MEWITKKQKHSQPIKEKRDVQISDLHAFVMFLFLLPPEKSREYHPRTRCFTQCFFNNVLQ
jgi:hypothetical protein